MIVEFTAGVLLLASGQPAAGPPQLTIREPLFRFASGSVELPPDAAEVIASQAREARARDAAEVRIISSTDTVGSAASNRRLARRRAEAVRRALVREGVPPGIIVIEAWGEERLVVQTGDGVSEPINRFIQIEVRS